MEMMPGIMPDVWIKEQSQVNNMIFPFTDQQVSKGVISYGVSAYGYDARISPDYRYISAPAHSLYKTLYMDPKAGYLDIIFVQGRANRIIIPPHGFILAKTIEYFKIPKDVLVVCVGKSTYARCGIIVNVTPLEPGWEGYVTLELSNTTDLPAVVYANEGICQFLFFKGGSPCSTTYSDRQGKYMNQMNIETAKVST